MCKICKISNAAYGAAKLAADAAFEILENSLYWCRGESKTGML